jgi:AraC-like DNA-binding protein
MQVDMINRARLRIRESLETDVTIQQIADEQGVSYSNFRKLFKEYTGLSPATYQQELRLLRAKELLTTTELSIKEIAYRLNFESPDYFSAKFKAKIGLKPSDIRAK